MRGRDVAERGALVEHVVPRRREAETRARPFGEKEVGDHPRAVLELRDVRRADALTVRLQQVLREKLRRREDDVRRPKPQRLAPFAPDGHDLDSARTFVHTTLKRPHVGDR